MQRCTQQFQGRTHGATLHTTFRYEVACNVADDGHTVKQLRDIAEVGADSTSATVARNVARSNFKGHGATFKLRAMLHSESGP